MTPDTLLAEADEVQGRAVRMRHDLHRRPEIGNDLPATQERILAELDDLPITVTTGAAVSSVVGVLEGAKPGPTVLLRGDMDALPLHEDSGVEFASRVDSAMHACGHDLHVSMLSAAARLLADRRADLAGRVLFMFQPGEEGHHGAKLMLDEGLLGAAGPEPVKSAFAIHVISTLPFGKVQTRGGPMMASSDTARITVHGRGGHGSAPHEALDPVPVACEIAIALQTMVARSIDVFDPAVVTVGQITSGTTSNVIPATAHLLLTIRALSEGTRRKVHDGVRRVAEHVAAAHEATADVEVESGYGVTVNDVGAAARAAVLAGEVLGTDHVLDMPDPVMGAEDFSYVLDEVPGCMVFLGAAAPGADAAQAPANHSNLVTFDDACMRDGVALYTAHALAELAAP